MEGLRTRVQFPPPPPTHCFMQYHGITKTPCRRQSVRGFLFQGVSHSNTTAHRKRGILEGIDDFLEVHTPNEIQPHRCRNQKRQTKECTCLSPMRGNTGVYAVATGRVKRDQTTDLKGALPPEYAIFTGYSG